MALKPTSSSGGTPISNELKSVPMEFLIGAPLSASIKAQRELGREMIEFVNMLAFGDSKASRGATSKEVVRLSMDLERPVVNESGVLSKQTITVAPPVLSLVPIPALLIDSVDITFSMEIHTVTASKENTDAGITVTGKGGVETPFYNASVEVTGKMSTQREHTRSTDKTAKYDVTVRASQQPPTEGMAKLMDLLASTVEPLSIGPAKK